VSGFAKQLLGVLVNKWALAKGYHNWVCVSNGESKKDTGIGFCESNKWALENSSHN
jgi:hypothetical protein